MATLTDPIHQMQTLAALFSQTFPIGAFSYSHGIESAIATGKIYDSILHMIGSKRVLSAAAVTMMRF